MEAAWETATMNIENCPVGHRFRANSDPSASVLFRSQVGSSTKADSACDCCRSVGACPFRDDLGRGRSGCLISLTIADCCRPVVHANHRQVMHRTLILGGDPIARRRQGNKCINAPILRLIPNGTPFHHQPGRMRHLPFPSNLVASSQDLLAIERIAQSTNLRQRFHGDGLRSVGTPARLSRRVSKQARHSKQHQIPCR